MPGTDPSRSSPPARKVDEILERISDAYRAVALDVEAYGDVVDGDIPESFDIDVDGAATHLRLPLRYWNAGRKSSRAVPALLAYEPHLDRSEFDELSRVLTGLDVLITVLDEIIDASTHERGARVDLAVNAAFSSLLAFASLPDDAADETVEVITRYLTEASRIPLVECEVQRKLADIDDVARAMDLIRFSYSFRARDVSAFATVPGTVADVDRETRSRIADDLHAHRVRSLLVDDVNDIKRDLNEGTETPVIWLLATLSEPGIVAERIDEVYRAFEYADGTEYREQLRFLENRPADFRDELAETMSVLRR